MAKRKRYTDFPIFTSHTIVTSSQSCEFDIIIISFSSFVSSCIYDRYIALMRLSEENKVTFL